MGIKAGKIHVAHFVLKELLSNIGQKVMFIVLSKEDFVGKSHGQYTIGDVKLKQYQIVLASNHWAITSGAERHLHVPNIWINYHACNTKAC